MKYYNISVNGVAYSVSVEETAAGAAPVAPAAAPAPKAAPAPAAAPAEEACDDTELVSVIAAAIAASEGRESADGLIVRSIKRVPNRNWK